ncbi:MAG: hypothetical protein IJX72_02045 [Clostridia bacterium]|nr:hypothetical protein [Clostridia bacterium]
MSVKPLYLKIAHAVRIVCVPPVMVGVLLVLLFTLRDDVFATTAEMVVSMLGLTVLPILAYPVSAIIPTIRKKGREGQRSLAMYLSTVGYVAVFVYGLIAGVGTGLMHIYTGYLLSVIIILIGNKVFKIRISGHACSVSGPTVYSAYFLGIWGIIVGVLCWEAILWASLVMKRHTFKEFILGTLTCLFSFAIGWLIFH